VLAGEQKSSGDEQQDGAGTHEGGGKGLEVVY
jgi:hypothetical protein